ATRDFDPDRYETRYDFCEVLVIGAGAAGLAAALSAAASGGRVVLAEQDSQIGGGLLSDTAQAGWLHDRLTEIAAAKNIRVCHRTSAVGHYDDNQVVLVERRDHTRPNPAKGQARQVL